MNSVEDIIRRLDSQQRQIKQLAEEATKLTHVVQHLQNHQRVSTEQIGKLADALSALQSVFQQRPPTQ